MNKMSTKHIITKNKMKTNFDEIKTTSSMKSRLLWLIFDTVTSSFAIQKRHQLFFIRNQV